MRIAIDTRGDVVKYTLIVSALAVCVPVSIVSIALEPFYPPHSKVLAGILWIAGLIPLFLAPPIVLGALLIVRSLNNTVDRINALVKYDGLTGALNRSHFLDHVRASQTDGMLLIIDADHFKKINDEYGHDVGDEALKALVHAVTTAVGDHGVVARLGGEEFGVHLPGVSQKAGALMAASIGAMVRRDRSVVVDNAILRMTVSIGGAFHAGNSPIGHALKIADQRLYEAKHAGRDQAITDNAVNRRGKLLVG